MTKITIERETLERLLDEWAVAAGQTWYHAGASRGIETGRCVSREDLRQLVRAALAAQPADTMVLSSSRWKMGSAPAQPADAQQEPVASYWLIECKNGFTGWYTGHRLDCRFFDTDPRKAYKFASKELAENEISERGHSCMIATEHVDIAAPPAEPPTDAWRMAVDAAMVGHALDCTTPDSDPATCVALLVKQVEDIWRDIAAQPAPAAVPLTDDEMFVAFCATHGLRQLIEAYVAGVAFAERHHGIAAGDKP